ncbi:MAG: 5'-3' exonuclease [Aeromicrobium sp.]
MSRLMLLDSASLYFRAFFGVPDTMQAPDGTVINAVRGMVDFVATLAEQYHPTGIVACWDDDWRPQWRVDLIDTYKTQRLDDSGAESDTTGGLLGPQVPLIAETMTLLGIPVVGAAEAEADDVIGALAAQADCPVDVVTGDRDLFQVVDDRRKVRVLYTARGVAKHDVVDAGWLREKYGVGPEQYVDFSVMRGDSSDGLPGVAGIGEKTAAVLLAEFGDLDGIVAAAHDDASSIKPRVRANLLSSGAYMAAAREVVTVRTYIVPPTDYVLEPLTEDRQTAFRAFGDTWGLGGSVDRVLDALSS